MYCDSITLLTMRLMRLGRTRFEAERIAASIMTGIVVMLTLMGYRLTSLTMKFRRTGRMTRTLFPASTP